MKTFSVLREILCAEHEFAHAFKRRLTLLGHLIPGSLQTGNGRSTQCGNDGCNGGEVIELAASL